MAGSHAVVVGGSMAGLCASAALARHFDRVTLVERDAFPTAPAPRAGTPQSRHVHALLVRGRRALEELFPGFGDALRAGGAMELDFGSDFAVLRALTRRWSPRATTDAASLFASRDLLDAAVRGRLARVANVAVLERSEVRGLCVEGARDRRVAGLVVHPRDGGAPRTLRADLVVDAGGRASHALRWLREAGIAPPDEVVVDAFAGYASRWYAAPARWPDDWWWRGVWIEGDPPDVRRGGVLFPVEGGRFVITAAGFSRQYPPTDAEAFTRWLGSLRAPLLADAAALGTPLTPVYAYRAMANRLYRYERWRDGPAGFVAMGDAACGFNPVYGQGMTVAALSAQLLGATVARLDPTSARLPATFFRAQARLLQQPWAMATDADFRFDTTRGPRSLLGRAATPYLDALFASLNDDAALLRRFNEVVHMIQPASALLTPDVVARVALSTLRRRTGRSRDGSAIPPHPPAG